MTRQSGGRKRILQVTNQAGGSYEWEDVIRVEYSDEFSRQATDNQISENYPGCPGQRYKLGRC
jgi:hypothetical protein